MAISSRCNRKIRHKRVYISHERRANFAESLCTPGYHTSAYSSGLFNDGVAPHHREWYTTERQCDRERRVAWN
jgi:hypothetical protein